MLEMVRRFLFHSFDNVSSVASSPQLSNKQKHWNISEYFLISLEITKTTKLTLWKSEKVFEKVGRFLFRSFRNVSSVASPAQLSKALKKAKMLKY